jgi:hypothetical protein
MGTNFAHVWFQISHKNSLVTVVTKLNSSWSHVDRCKFFIHLRSLKVRNVGMVKAMVLKIMVRSLSTV